MEESLKCANCKDYAVDAVESDCACHLIYCEKCSFKTINCNLCNQRMSRKNPNPALKVFGFTENILARRMIGSMKTKCIENDCGYETTIGEIKTHWRKCKERKY